MIFYSLISHELLISWTPIKNTIFWKSIMRYFRWIEINSFNIFRFLAEVSTNLKTCTILGNLRTITQERKMEIRQMTPFFSSTFWGLTVWYSFLYLKIAKIHFNGVVLSSVLVCKVPEFWRCKLWDQNFVSFDSGNIHIKESEKPGFFFFFRVENEISLMSWSTFASSIMLFRIGLKLRF